MDETWTSRDLPVLTASVEVFERTGRVMSPNEIEEQSGLRADEVEAALRALEGEDPPFITKLERRASGGIGLVGKPTGHARRAVGAGPTLESIADRLITALDEAADREPDPERKGWLRKTAAYLGNAGRDLAVDIGASAINRQMGTSPWRPSQTPRLTSQRPPLERRSVSRRLILAGKSQNRSPLCRACRKTTLGSAWIEEPETDLERGL